MVYMKRKNWKNKSYGFFSLLSITHLFGENFSHKRASQEEEDLPENASELVPVED